MISMNFFLIVLKIWENGENYAFYCVAEEENANNNKNI